MRQELLLLLLNAEWKTLSLREAQLGDIAEIEGALKPSQFDSKVCFFVFF